MIRRILKDDKLFVLKFKRFRGKYDWGCYDQIRAYDYFTHQTVGFVQFTVRSERNELLLQSLYITDDAKLNVGIGSVLLDSVEKYALAHNATNIVGWCIPSGKGKSITPYFYKKHGFKLEGIFLTEDLLHPLKQEDENFIKVFVHNKNDTNLKKS